MKISVDELEGILQPESHLRIHNYKKEKILKSKTLSEKIKMGVRMGEPDFYYLYDKRNGYINFTQAGFFDYEPILVPNNYIDISTDQITLRDYQERPIEELLKKNYGFLEAATGWGKSYCMGYIINQLKLKTVILTHNLIVGDQTVDRLKEFFGDDKVGVFNKNKKEFKDITVICYPSYEKFLALYNGQFDVLIVDEADLFASWARIDLLLESKVTHQYGLSATMDTGTIKRKDFELLYGRIVEAFEYWDILLNSFNFHIKCVEVKYEVAEAKTFHELKAKVYENPARIEAIRKCIDDSKGGKILILTDSVSYCERIAEELWTAYLVGKLSKKKRKEQLDLFEKISIMTSNHQIVGRGYDDPDIDTVIVAFTTRSVPNLKQVIGRGLRTKEGKNDLYFYDIKDSDIKWQWYTRKKVWEQFGEIGYLYF